MRNLRKAVLPLLLALSLLLVSCGGGDKAYTPPEWLDGFDFAAEHARVMALVTTSGADDASLSELRTLMERTAELPYYFFSTHYTGGNKTELTDYARTVRNLYQLMLDTQKNAWRWQEVSAQTNVYLESLRGTKAPDADPRWLPSFAASPQNDPMSAVLACFFRAKRAAELKSNIISITFGGDVTFGQRENANAATSFDTAFSANNGNSAYPLSLLAPYLKSDSLTVMNCMGTLTNQTEPQNPETALRGSPGYADIFKVSSVDAVDVGGPHTMDYFESGYEDTVTNLTQRDINTFGRNSSALCEADGVSIGLLSYDLTQATEPPAGLDGTLKRDADALRGRGAQLIITSFHWGVEYSDATTALQTKVARLAVDAGADMVVGHGPHVLQGMELYNGKPIAYSLGSLVLDSERAIDTKTGHSMLLRQSWQKNADGSLTLLPSTVLPVYTTSGGDTNNFMPYPLFGDGSSHVVRLLFKLSRPFESGVKELASIG